MKLFICLAASSLLFTTALAQAPEFAVNTNGLIYPEYTVKQLKRIVDSLNLKFKQCELHTTYYSIPQARAHFIRLEKGDIQKAIREMASGISFDSFIKKYEPAAIRENRLVFTYQYKPYNKAEELRFSTIGLADEDEGRYEVTVTKYIRQYSNAKKHTWVIEHSPKSTYSPESVDALFMMEDLTALPLAPSFARLVQYADCLIDTTTGIYLPEASKRNVFGNDEVKYEKLNRALVYVNKLTNRPVIMNDYDEYHKRLNEWDTARFRIIDEHLKTDSIWKNLLRDALEEAEKTMISSDELEDYISRYISPKKALQLKRSRVVMGQCSQDDSPRQHAVNIARLSAEAVAWEVFLRAHLDIMNDRFQRLSDGSYAWAKRQTYIKELEVLDINVVDLLLGINLRISNPSANHYFGNISRTGRALAESKDLKVIETKLLELIKNKELDLYNRVLMYYLFLNYNHHLDDKVRQAKNQTALKEAITSFPDYLTTKTRTAKDK